MTKHMILWGWAQLRRQATRLRDEDRGLALTEYLILLGLLTSGVVLAAISIGGSLSLSWAGWAGFYNSLPSISGTN